VRTTQDVLALLRAARPQLAREFGVTRLALFGSYARGDQREDSDVDVLVEVDPSIGLRFVELADRIEALLGVRSDVVSRRAIGPRHWMRIERPSRCPIGRSAFSSRTCWSVWSCRARRRRPRAPQRACTTP